jgi:hypothetical protein
MDEFTVIFVLILIIMVLIFGIFTVDDMNPGEICTERNFGAEALIESNNNGSRIYWCLRVIDGTPEARPLEWVEENCGNNGVCVDD